MSEIKSVDCDEEMKSNDTLPDSISCNRFTTPAKSAIQRIFHTSKLERFEFLFVLLFIVIKIVAPKHKYKQEVYAMKINLMFVLNFFCLLVRVLKNKHKSF
jgi:hypothetical protein